MIEINKYVHIYINKFVNITYNASQTSGIKSGKHRVTFIA